LHCLDRLTQLPLLCGRWRLCPSDTYVEKSGIGAIPDDVGCPLHARNNPGMNLVGTVCVPNNDTAMAAQPNDIFYINFEDPGWTCKGRDDGGGGRPDAFVALINLLFAFGWSTIVGIVCCYCRNKSQNTAPFNGEFHAAHGRKFCRVPDPRCSAVQVAL
jgi:hypothetical protein